MINLLKQAIQFYDRFLEKQRRYQQETSEQRQSEQDWLANCRQELEKMPCDMENILASRSSTAENLQPHASSL